jgi:predicted negative regulator of RcsB-dependent stress response
VDRAHRHDLKHDKFVEQVGHTVEYAAEHKQAFVRWGAIGLAVLVLGLGWLFYSRSQANARQDALRRAIQVQEANVGEGATPFLVSYPTEAEKAAAVQKTWTELVNKYPGSAEAMIGHYYMAINAADKGNIPEAEKQFKIVADSGKDAYASQAKFSLAQIYASAGKNDEAEKLLRSLIDDPTVMVSKEQATIMLARTMLKTKPAEARKLLEPLRTERGPVSRAAITLLSEIPAK